MSKASPSIDPKVLARRERQARYRAKFTKEDKAHRLTLQRDWYNKNRAKALWFAARTRARTKGLDFEIEPGDIVIPISCPVLGIPMTSPSLDRKDNRLGYVKGNVFVISRRANELKRDATLAEVLAVAEYMRH